MPAKRIPWIKFWPEMLDHEKFAELSDSESWTWVNVWGKASQQPVRWRFASAQHAAKVSGRPLAQVRRLITARLLDERSDGSWIHDYQQWQHRYPSDFEDSANAPSTPDEEPLNDSSTTPEDSAKTPRTLPEDSANDAVITSRSASRTHERAKKGEGRREKGERDGGAAGSADPPPMLLAVPRPNRSGLVIDAIRAIGLEPSLTDRDHAALKKSNAPPETIAEVYGEVFNGRYGDAFMQQRLSVHEAIEWIPGYQSFKANGLPRPVLVGRNGYADRPRRIVDHTGCPVGCSSTHPEQGA